MSTQSRKEKEVWAACEKLHKKGQKLTYKAIGDMLSTMGYCRGSNSDIYRYLTTWREKKEGKPKAPTNGQQVDVSVLQEAIWQEANEAMERMKSQFVEQVNHLEAECERLKAAAPAAVPEAATETTSLSPTAEPSTDALSPDSPLIKAVEQAVSGLIKHHEASLLRLFDHHQVQFDQYMSALEHLRNANNLLSNQMASLRATHTAQLQDRDRQVAEAKEHASRERKRRMQLERALQAEKSTGV